MCDAREYIPREYIPLDSREGVSLERLPTKAHVSKIMEELNIIDHPGARKILIKHIEAAEMRGYNQPIGEF